MKLVRTKLFTNLENTYSEYNDANDEEQHKLILVDDNFEIDILNYNVRCNKYNNTTNFYDGMYIDFELAKYNIIINNKKLVKYYKIVTYEESIGKKYTSKGNKYKYDEQYFHVLRYGDDTYDILESLTPGGTDERPGWSLDDKFENFCYPVKFKKYSIDKLKSIDIHKQFIHYDIVGFSFDGKIICAFYERDDNENNTKLRFKKLLEDYPIMVSPISMIRSKKHYIIII